jgi:hypothetical protein
VNPSVRTVGTTNPFELSARKFEPTPPQGGQQTVGHARRARLDLDPRTRQTPALGLIDAALVGLLNAPKSG